MSTKTAPRQKPSESLDTGIAAKDRNAVAEQLKHLLADTYVLLIKTHVYHWNVVGPLFVPLHELTEKHYNDLFAATDELAERIRALGVKAPLSFAEFLAHTTVEEETRNRAELEMVENLIDGHEMIARGFRDAAKDADEAEDLVTVDLMTRRLAFHEKAIWMLRATVGK
jgi:starvation-inducible DNA-binding protein